MISLRMCASIYCTCLISFCVRAIIGCSVIPAFGVRILAVCVISFPFGMRSIGSSIFIAFNVRILTICQILSAFGMRIRVYSFAVKSFSISCFTKPYLTKYRFVWAEYRPIIMIWSGLIKLVLTGILEWLYSNLISIYGCNRQFHVKFSFIDIGDHVSNY